MEEQHRRLLRIALDCIYFKYPDCDGLESFPLRLLLFFSTIQRLFWISYVVGL